MKKINNYGFALVETLVVSVFVTIIFTFLYINVMPLIGSYEAEERYDSIDVKYTANLVRNEINYYLNSEINEFNNIENSILIKDALKEKLKTENYIDLTSCDVKIDNINVYGTSSSATRNRCEELRILGSIKGVYLTTFNVANLKKKVSSSDEFINSGMDAYISFMPSYEHVQSDASYRLIIALSDIYGNNNLYYGTIEMDI